MTPEQQYDGKTNGNGGNRAADESTSASMETTYKYEDGALTIMPAESPTESHLPWDEELVDVPVIAPVIDRQHPAKDIDKGVNRGVGYHEAIRELAQLNKNINSQSRTPTAAEEARMSLLADTISQSELAAEEAFKEATGQGTQGRAKLSKIETLIEEYPRLSEAQKEDLKREISRFALIGVDYGSVSRTTGVAQGNIIEAMESKIRSKKSELEADFMESKDKWESSLDYVLPLVEDESKDLRERVGKIDKLRSAEDQRLAVRVILAEMEGEEMTPEDNNFRQYRSQLELLMERRGMHPEVVLEIDSRIRLQVCWASMKRVNLAVEPDQVKKSFSEAVNRIGSYYLNGESLNFFLGDQAYGGEAKGMFTKRAFEIMQERAAAGAYSGSKSEPEVKAIVQSVVDQLYSEMALVDPSVEYSEVEKSVQLADRLSESLYEKALWDTSAGQLKSQSYMSEAIYFSTYRTRDRKGSVFSRGDIPSIATSFLRRLKFSESSGSKRVFDDDEWKQINANMSSKERKARMVSLQTFSGAGSMLDTSGIDFRQIEGNAYKSYLESYIPQVFQVRDLILRTDFDLQYATNRQQLLKDYELFQKFDPQNCLNLFFLHVCHVWRAASFKGAYASKLNDALADLVDRGVTSGNSDEGRIFLLPKKTTAGQDMVAKIRDVSGFQVQGASAAFDDILDDVTRVRKG